MKKILMLMALVICALGVNAQNTKVITGAVIDKNGNPLPNALVEATGGAESVSTDADGSFRIEVPIWLKSLTARYAGFPDKVIKLDGRSQVIFEMTQKHGNWFLNLAASADINDYEASGTAGLMGGYLGKWGGYAKIVMPFYAVVPSFTAGVIKRIYKPFHWYLGVGYTQVEGDDYYYGDDIEDGAMFETGAIFKIHKIDLSVGYAFCTSFCCYDSHQLQLSVGYCF